MLCSIKKRRKSPTPKAEGRIRNSVRTKEPESQGYVEKLSKWQEVRTSVQESERINPRVGFRVNKAHISWDCSFSTVKLPCAEKKHRFLITEFPLLESFYVSELCMFLIKSLCPLMIFSIYFFSFFFPICFSLCLQPLGKSLLPSNKIFIRKKSLF